MKLVSKDISGWELHEIADGSLSCENPKLTDNDISEVEAIVRAKFGERLDKEDVFVSYDNWSGVFIMQLPGKKNHKSDELIKEIYEWMIHQ